MYTDIFYIEGDPLLQVADKATQPQAAKWLKNVLGEHLWKVLSKCGIDVDFGSATYYIWYRKIFHEMSFHKMLNCWKLRHAIFCNRVHTNQSIESANFAPIVERYQAHLWRSFLFVKKKAPDVDIDYAVQPTEKAINDSTGPNGLVLIRLVFSRLPRLGLPTVQLTLSTIECAVAQRKAARTVSHHFSKQRVCNAMNVWDGSMVTDIRNSTTGLPVLSMELKNTNLRALFCWLIETEQPTVSCYYTLPVH